MRPRTTILVLSLMLILAACGEPLAPTGSAEDAVSTVTTAVPTEEWRIGRTLADPPVRHCDTYHHMNLSHDMLIHSAQVVAVLVRNDRVLDRARVNLHFFQMLQQQDRIAASVE